MDSRERTFLTLERVIPDRIPVDFWASDSLRSKLESELRESYEDFLDGHDIDLRYIPGPQYAGPPLIHDHLEYDIWGVPRQTVRLQLGGAEEWYKEVARPPLADATSVEEVLAYPNWPSPDWYDYDGIEAQCDSIMKEKRVVVFMGDRLNRVAQLKPAMYLRGEEQLLVDLALNPDMVQAILRKIRQFYAAYLERILACAKGKIDIVLTGDDFGSQNGLLLSVPMWKQYLMNGFKAYMEIIKAHRAWAMHHTCGSVFPLIPEMIDCGLDILQSVQPEAKDMSGRKLKDAFGSKLSFHGGVSIQKTLPAGSTNDIQQEVKNLSETLGRGGGYIFCTSHNIQADTPVANVKELLEAYRKYGPY